MRENSLKISTEKKYRGKSRGGGKSLSKHWRLDDGFVMSVPEDCGGVIYCICRYPRQRFFDVT